MGDYDDAGPDNTLGPSESLDSDEVRNDDGDIVVDPPEQWIDAEDDEVLLSPEQDGLQDLTVALALFQAEFIATDRFRGSPGGRRGGKSGRC